MKDKTDVAVATVENGKIVIRVNGLKLVEGKKIGIKVRKGEMSEIPCPGHKQNTGYCCGDVDIVALR